MSSTFGYTRVSSTHHIVEHEVTILKDAGASHVYVEGASLGASKRLALDELLSACTAGDQILVLYLNRLGRSLEEILRAVKAIASKNLHLRSIGDRIDTLDANDSAFMTFAALINAQRHIAGELTQRGMENAAAKGRVIGRPTVDHRKIEEALRLISGGMPVAQAAERAGCTAPTLYRYLARARASGTAFSVLT